MSSLGMQPSLSYPFHVRSFFADHKTKGIGSGLELCKSIFVPTYSLLTLYSGHGYFQSLRLQRFSCGIRILTTHCGPDGKKHTTLCAAKAVTIADYFQRTQNKPLQFSDVIWAEVGSGALICWNCATCPRSNSCASRSPRGKPRTCT
ncbi:hypothetical protein B0H14DRAFT_2792048, partial [Mycena olivaceomarginata]